MLSYRHRSLLSSLLAFVVISTALSAVRAVASRDASSPAGDAGQARAAFDQGKALLRRNRADQALPLLESALNLYTQAGDDDGAAAAHDALGDIYQRQGQYDAALQNYQSAYDAFHAKNELPNANLLLAKIGETQYLAGNADAARAAFAQITQPLLSAANNKNGNNQKKGSPLMAFAAFSSAMPSLAACASLKSNNNNNNSDNPNDSSNDLAGGKEPPNMGHAPGGLDKIGRMDLRVVDQNGDPVQGAKARLATVRPNGLHCDCTNSTDATGRALMNPIHVGQHLKLEVKADGFEPQTIEVSPDDLSKPYRLTMQAKNAAKAAKSVAKAKESLQAQKATSVADPVGACLDLSRLFSSFELSELGLGRVDFKNNDLNSAQSHFENALAAADVNAPAGGLLAARLFRAVARTSLGDVAYQQGRYEDAIKLYTQAADVAKQDERPELMWGAQRGIGRARLALAAQEHDPQIASKTRDDAIRNYRLALNTIEKILAGGLRADDARASFLATTSDVFDEASSALAEMALRLASSSTGSTASQALAHAPNPSPAPLERQALVYAAEAFKIVEQGRARSLLDLLGEARAEITQGVPADLLARKADNLARQQEIADALTGVTLAGATAPKQPVKELEAELNRLSLEYDALENQIKTTSPRYATLTRTQPLTLAEVQQQVLDNSTVLLEYRVGRERSYLWAATKSGLTLYPLPGRAEIDQQVVALRDQLIPTGARRSLASIEAGDSQRGVGSELNAQTDERGLAVGAQLNAPQSINTYTAAARTLYQTVLAPAAAVIGDKRLLIVSSGALNFVPFEALVTAEPNGEMSYASLDYLIKTNEIVYAPSASVVAAIRQQTGSAAPVGSGMLVVADPVFDAGDARAKTLAGKLPATNEAARRSGVINSALADVMNLKAKNFRLARLNGTRTEAQEIAQLARASGSSADVWLDFDASEANVKARELSKYRVLHFATHGLLDAQRPQFTGLALSLVGDADDDGFLRVGEVFNLRLGTPIVILSACETGLGKEERGEGVIGLTRAFIYAGAPTVGVSLWSVADRSTAELMPNFYKRLLAGGAHAGPAAALRGAQQEMIAGKRYSAPFYWAPFVLVGDWK